eukprot:CAMPEP_0176220758 /NCGR_PEP_ID=MMETSP0121_2-20121125/19379_1 /TAXON_ID=160619 /ORGANISM="Kryptoperidinium foliaceum, Strain CCMP 1326" /LENGTH=296 /DNA_ID=CAMNT_0017559941 /DNA_START=88 /DNA_END=974 /DNA_ORIENTATION=+
MPTRNLGKVCLHQAGPWRHFAQTGKVRVRVPPAATTRPQSQRLCARAVANAMAGAHTTRIGLLDRSRDNFVEASSTMMSTVSGTGIEAPAGIPEQSMAADSPSTTPSAPGMSLGAGASQAMVKRVTQGSLSTRTNFVQSTVDGGVLLHRWVGVLVPHVVADPAELGAPVGPRQVDPADLQRPAGLQEAPRGRGGLQDEAHEALRQPGPVPDVQGVELRVQLRPRRVDDVDAAEDDVLLQRLCDIEGDLEGQVLFGRRPLRIRDAHAGDTAQRHGPPPEWARHARPALARRGRGCSG